MFSSTLLDGFTVASRRTRLRDWRNKTLVAHPETWLAHRGLPPLLSLFMFSIPCVYYFSVLIRTYSMMHIEYSCSSKCWDCSLADQSANHGTNAAVLLKPSRDVDWHRSCCFLASSGCVPFQSLSPETSSRRSARDLHEPAACDLPRECKIPFFIC